MGYFAIKLIKFMVGITEKKQWFRNYLFHYVASSASIERIFSNYSFIQNELKNRLELQAALKLVMTYKILNSKDKNLGSYKDY